mgnify:CR=1 FL=1
MLCLSVVRAVERWARASTAYPSWPSERCRAPARHARCSLNVHARILAAGSIFESGEDCDDEDGPVVSPRAPMLAPLGGTWSPAPWASASATPRRSPLRREIPDYTPGGYQPTPQPARSPHWPWWGG